MRRRRPNGPFFITKRPRVVCWTQRSYHRRRRPQLKKKFLNLELTSTVSRWQALDDLSFGLFLLFLGQLVVAELLLRWKKSAKTHTTYVLYTNIFSRESWYNKYSTLNWGPYFCVQRVPRKKKSDIFKNSWLSIKSSDTSNRRHLFELQRLNSENENDPNSYIYILHIFKKTRYFGRTSI